MKYKILVLVVFLSSCAIFKKPPKSQNDPKSIEFVQLLQERSDSLRTYKSRFSLKFSSGSERISLLGKVAIVRDSFANLNISLPLGIDVARVFATPDTFVVYIPTKNTYYAGNSDLAMKKYGFPVDFSTIQGLFFSENFVYPCFYKEEEYIFRYDSVPSYKRVIYNKKIKRMMDVMHVTNYSANEKCVSDMSIFDFVLPMDFVLENSKFTNIDEIYLPQKTSIYIKLRDTMNINFSIKNISVNKNILDNFKVPKNAKLISY